LMVTYFLIALFALGFAEYALALLPDLNAKYIALGVLLTFYIVNLLGIRQAAAIQKVMIAFLLCGLSSLIFFGILEVDYTNFTDQEKLFPDGWYGFGMACVLMSFATGGAYYVSELGGEMKNPHHDLPRAIIYSTLVAAFFIATVSIVAVGILPVEQTAGKTLAEVARVILPPSLYAAFIVSAALFAFATSINSTFSWATKSVMIACEDGWLPRRLAVVNKRFNTPHIMLTILLIVASIPILADKDMRYIIMLGSGLVFIYDIIPLLAAFYFAKKLPEVFANAHFRMSEKTLKTISVIGILILLVQANLAFSDIDNTGRMMIVGYIIMVIVYIQKRSKIMGIGVKDE
jgi:APA family basic amino acid/polyamine antiporter